MTSPSLPKAATIARVRNDRARTAITLGAALALLCVAVFGLEAPESLAANGLFDALFGGGSPAYVPTLPYNGYLRGPGASRSHYGYRRHARHAKWRHHARDAQARRRVVGRHQQSTTERDAAALRRPAGIETLSFAEASATTPKTTAAASRRTICVRGCDGYYFPVARLNRESDIPAQQATCERLCPGAQPQLFVMAAGSDRIEDAKAARGGDTYAQLVARLNPADARSRSCACQSAVDSLGVTSAFLGDSTLRPGDTVVTPQGIRVVKRGSRYPFKQSDFLALAETRDVPLSNRSALFAIERALKTPVGRLAVMNNDHRRNSHRRDADL